MRLQVTLGDEDLGVFDPEDVMVEDLIRLEDVTKMTILEVANGMLRASGRAIQALVWFQRMRQGKAAEPYSNFRLSDLKTKDLDEDLENPTDAVPAALDAKPSKTASTVTSGS